MPHSHLSNQSAQWRHPAPQPIVSHSRVNSYLAAAQPHHPTAIEFIMVETGIMGIETGKTALLAALWSNASTSERDDAIADAIDRVNRQENVN